MRYSTFSVPLTPPFLGNVGVVLTAGIDSKRYCAEFGGEPRKNDETLTKRTNAEKPPQCPSVQPTPTATTTPADTATLTPTPTATWAPGTTITGILIQSGGLTRSYNVHIPTGYDGTVAVPLVLDLHGSGANGVGQELISGFRAVADANGFIVAYPDGEFQQWNAGVCCDPAAAAGVDDVGFARAVVADIASKTNIDALRVYATGLSNGGGMTHRLACEAADVFAAAAPVAFPLALDPLTACQPVRPISVLHFAGLTDMIIPYDGGTAVSPVTGQVFTVPSAPASFAYWAATSGCGDGAPDMVEDLGNGASCDTYTTCAAGVEVGLCSIHGTVLNGHFLYANSDGVNVAQRAWDFMSAFTLPTE
jgi:poly(3-hydroxybutyrate) depolymerase